MPEPLRELLVTAASSSPLPGQKDNGYLSRPADGPVCGKLEHVDVPPTGSSPTAAEFEIRRITTRAELEAALVLRYEVFCVEQGVPRREERDGRDHDATHLIAVKDDLVIATCRLVFVGTTVQFSRFAVARTARRQGVATAMLRVADEQALARGANRVVLHAQTYVRSLYEQAGYIARGREFVEADIEHVAMEKLL
jgi:predicted GNAT family N-acyltransferase